MIFQLSIFSTFTVIDWYGVMDSWLSQWLLPSPFLLYLIPCIYLVFHSENPGPQHYQNIYLYAQSHDIAKVI